LFVSPKLVQYNFFGYTVILTKTPHQDWYYFWTWTTRTPEDAVWAPSICTELWRLWQADARQTYWPFLLFCHRSCDACFSYWKFDNLSLFLSKCKYV